MRAAYKLVGLVPHDLRCRIGPHQHVHDLLRYRLGGLEDNGADLYEDEAMRLLVVLASFSTVIGLAAPAHADAAGYLAELGKAGVSYSDPTDATNAGLSICHGLENGGSFDTAIDSETAAGYSEHDAGFIVGAAVENLCPDLAPAMSQWLQDRKQPPPPPSPRVPDYIPLPGPFEY